MLATPLEVLAEELGTISGQFERNARQLERESRLRMDAAIADLQRHDAERELRFVKLERRFEELAASVKNGDPGERGAEGPQGLPGTQGECGERGEQGERGEVGQQGEAGAQGERGVAGERGDPGLLGPQGARGLQGESGERGEAGSIGPTGERGLQGERGVDGVDGRSIKIRGTFKDGEVYKELDQVALNGASFTATRDNPGPCPSTDGGWQLSAKQGEAGKPGKPGDPGRSGKDGPKVKALSIDGEGLVTLQHEDGSTVDCDLYPVLAKISRAK